MNQYLGKIDPQFGKDEFLRKVWISLAKEDVPYDVFKENCGEIEEVYHLVLAVDTDYQSSWTADIGNDRQESYVDFETYYEKIPYTAYEKRYNSSKKITEDVPVTKYREEARQRQVTKFRTVTDWHTGSGNYSGSVRFFDSVDRDGQFDTRRFFKDYDKYQVCWFSKGQEPSGMHITDDMLNFAYGFQKKDIERETKLSVPGDRDRGFSCQITGFNPTSASLILVPEYVTTFKYHGETYVKKGFPFGNMAISKVGIPNPCSAESEAKRMTCETQKENKKRNDDIEPKIWDRTKIISFATIGCLVVSVIFSILIKYLFLVLIGFFGAAGLAAYSFINLKSTREKVEKETRQANAAASAACAERINNYEKHHYVELLGVLNEKLVSLGFSPLESVEAMSCEGEA